MKPHCWQLLVDGVPVRLQRSSKKPPTRKDMAALRELVRAVRKRYRRTGRVLRDVKVVVKPKKRRVSR